MKKALFMSFLLAGVLLGDSFTNSIGMKFVEIPEGDLLVGKQPKSCPEDNPYTEINEFKTCLEALKKSENVRNNFHLKRFYMQTTEVTQEQWFSIMGTNPSQFKTGNATMPVEQVSFSDARKFIKLLNAKENTTKYDLPTEAQWEYVSCAGKPVEHSCEENLDRCGDTVTLKGVNTPLPVASKEPNAWGIYDAKGNVWEWVKECYVKPKELTNSKATPEEEPKCTTCCWVTIADDCGSVFRFNYSSDYRYFSVGFRVVATTK